MRGGRERRAAGGSHKHDNNTTQIKQRHHNTTTLQNNNTTPPPKQKDYFWRWTHYLKWYAGEPTSKIFTGGDSFDGCGGNGANELDYVEFSAPYNWGGDRWVCLDGVVLQ